MSEDMIDIGSVIIHNSPDVRTWPITATVTRLEFRPTGVHVEHSKMDGPQSWPDFTPPGWDGALQFSLWIFLRIAGEWHGSGCIQFWRGCDENGGPPESFAKDWYYAEDRWAPMTGHQPAPGELVGFMVTAGDARNNGTISVQERSSIVAFPFPVSGWAYTPSALDPQTPPIVTPAPPVVQPGPDILGDYKNVLVDLRQQIADLNRKVDALIAKPDPDYVGSVPYLGKLTLKAVK